MNLSVTQVSEALGYPVPGQFSRAFKQHFGLSPKAYQQQVLARG
jgi:AraC-like DNA-binding protein